MVSAAGGSDDHSLVGEGGDLAHLAECSEPECSWKTPPVMELQVADRENWAEEFLSSASGSFVVYKERGGGEHNRSGTFVSFDEDLNLDPEVEADLLQESFDVRPCASAPLLLHILTVCRGCVVSFWCAVLRLLHPVPTPSTTLTRQR